MTPTRCMSDAPLIFKGHPADVQTTRYDRYHSRARSPEKDPGEAILALSWLLTSSLGFIISVTPESHGWLQRRYVDALGDPDTHPCPPTNTPEVTT